ncbi:MAG: DUF2314 domain-containing protein [bacterium]|nr:DUF2314 domain-containing protein [Candidatus Kapabacteria bacterium]
MRSLYLLLLIVTFVACGSKPENADTNAPVVFAEKNDGEMNAAIQQARAGLDGFESTLNAPKPNQTKFGVKVGIPHSAGSEHVWLGSPIFEADSLVGVVEEVPMYAKTIKVGELIRVHRHGISDWMYLEDGKLRGGFTMRVAIDRLPPDQQAEQKKQLGIE